MSLRRRLALLSAVAGALALIAVVVSVLSFLYLLRERRAVISALDPATITTDSLLTAYLNEETAVRGYAVSTNPTFLEPFQQGRADARQLTAQLLRLVRGRSDLEALVAVVMRRATAWENQYAIPAAAATPSQVSTYASPARLAASKQLFDANRAAFTALDGALGHDRAVADHRLDVSTHRLALALLGALLLVIVVGITVWRALRSWVLAPLQSLAADARDITDGSLGHEIAPVGPPEMAAFAGDLEGMRKRIVGELDSVEAARAELAVLNEDLARSNVELEQFAYVASHDLQEPLRKVISFCQLLGERYRGQLDDRADQYIDFAVDGAKRMQVLINDLLAFSRVGRNTERFGTVDLTACARAAAATMAHVAEEEGAQVRIGELPKVPGDQTLLTALLQNLIGNALKFRSEAAPIVDVTAVGGADADEWTISVSDNGIGIEPRFADRIFVIFQRLHAREAYEGTGIGLALCKKIVEFHGGRIWLDTDFTGGTRFTFTLPVHGAVHEPH